jgi:hypothetical protein
VSTLSVGSWRLPSGNSVDVLYRPGLPGHLIFQWDIPPSPSWPQADREHYERVVRPLVFQKLAARGLVAR